MLAMAWEYFLTTFVFSIFLILFIYFMCTGIFVHVCLCTMYVASVRFPGTRVTDVGSCHVGAGNGTQQVFLWKSNKCFEQPSCCSVFVYTV